MVLAQALRAVCDDLEKHDPQAPSLHFARGVLAGCKGVRVVGVSREQPKRGYRGKYAEHAAGMAADYQAGMTLFDVAQKFGCAPSVVRLLVSAEGVEIRPPGAKHMKRGDTDPRVPQFMAMRAAGATGAEIGRAFGITRERVRQLIEKAGKHDEFHVRPFKPHEIEALEEYRAGQSLDYVAAKLGVNSSTARGYLTRHGIPIRPSRKLMKQREERDRLAAQIAGRYRAGENVADIARAFGFKKPEQIYRYLAVAGVKPARALNGVKTAAAVPA